MGRRFLFLLLIMAVLCVPLGIAHASRPALAATTPEVWDEEAPEGEEPAIDEEDDVWNEPESSDPSLDEEAPDAAEEVSAPKPVPPQPAPVPPQPAPKTPAK